MKVTLGDVLSGLYTISQTIVETTNMGSSILMAQDPGYKLKTINYVVAYVVGAITGAVEFANTSSLQGKVIRDKWKVEEELEKYIDENASTKKNTLYLTCKYTYLVSAVTVNYLMIGFLYSASKAYLNDLKNGQDLPLTFVSHTEGMILLLYYILFDLPFILSTEVPQTWEALRKMFHIADDNTPDEKLISFFLKCIRPFVQSNIFRKYVRIAGTITDTIEHLIPLILLFSPSLIKQIAQSSALVEWLAGLLGFLGFNTVAFTILAQTYLFEGSYSERNMRSVISRFGKALPEDKPWITQTLSKIFHYLLYVGGPLHGIDTGLDLFLTLKELESPAAIAHISSILTFVIAWMGNHYSEVTESQEALRKITLPEEDGKQIKMTAQTYFFAKPKNKDYGTAKEVTYEKYPICLMESDTSMEYA